ncbi:restriction endonuclease subunit S [Nostoc sp. FACHB-133]|uniref:restriction endonuclease subunit S n=1 Tax=Nostoc sp. FACHB-133 TaxID=2692835 RepID=UPI001683D859|nr:restriction endonuclease subunit S [Nostoc sp. FACHB-133]MBD2527377.1 restriction endonuclease subunit S [Nostoc sp. FACHB-133]
MGKYQGYEKYKDSGVEWLGEIPEHWNIQKFIRAAFFQEGPGLRNWQFADNGIRVICVTNITEKGIDFSSYQKFIEQEDYEKNYKHFTVKNNDLLLSSSGNSWGKVAEYNSDEIVVLNTSTIRINEHETSCADRVFLKWTLQSFCLREQLSLLMTGSCQPNFGPSHLAKTIIAIPPLDEQKTIARFLDYKTKQIDDLIAKKEALIEKLDEKRTALISHAVTKGLDPNVPMRDSGVEWLGEIPKHWKPVKLKYICSLLRDGTHLPPPRVDNGIPLLSVRNIINNCFVNLEDDSLISEKDFQELNKSFQVLENDILLAIVGATLGKVAIVKKMPRFTIQRSLAVLRSKAGVCVHKFLFYFIKSPDFQKLLWLNTGFSAQPGIYLGSLANFFVPIPPIAEQAKIITYLDQKITQIDQQKDKIKEAIERLKEYRTALITNAVTGKIDVRQVPIS